MSSTEYVEPFVGKKLTQQSFQVNDALLRDHYEGLELDASDTGLLPSTLGSEPDNSYFREIAYRYQKGHLWLRQQIAFSQPIVKDATYTVTGQIEDIYPRRNRNVVHYSMNIVDENDKQAIRTDHHQSFLQEEVEGGSVELRKPSQKPGARKFIIPEGEKFGGLTRVITREMCGTYFHGDANYHTDKASAEQLGFEDVVVGGRMTLAYTARILEDRFQDLWWRSGTLDLKFTNPVWCDDEVTVNGVILPSNPDDPSRTRIFAWIAKADGTIVLVADASVAK